MRPDVWMNVLVLVPWLPHRASSRRILAARGCANAIVANPAKVTIEPRRRRKVMILSMYPASSNSGLSQMVQRHPVNATPV